MAPTRWHESLEIALTDITPPKILFYYLVRIMIYIICPDYTRTHVLLILFTNISRTYQASPSDHHYRIHKREGVLDNVQHNNAAAIISSSSWSGCCCCRCWPDGCSVWAVFFWLRASRRVLFFCPSLQHTHTRTQCVDCGGESGCFAVCIITSNSTSLPEKGIHMNTMQAITLSSATHTHTLVSPHRTRSHS